MVKIGLPLNFAKYLQRSDKIRNALLKSSRGVQYSQALQKTASEMARSAESQRF